MRWTSSVAGVVAVLVVASIWYVQAPPRGADAYRGRAAATFEALRSQVETARLWAAAVEDDDVTRQAATVAFRETEVDAEAAVSRFAGYDPPGEELALRTEVTAVGDDVVAALAKLRIAAEDGRWGEIATFADPLEPVARELEILQRAAEQ